MTSMHTMACCHQHMDGDTYFTRGHGHLICNQQQELFIIIFKCKGHLASKKIQSLNQNAYIRMNMSITLLPIVLHIKFISTYRFIFSKSTVHLCYNIHVDYKLVSLLEADKNILQSYEK